MTESQEKTSEYNYNKKEKLTVNNFVLFCFYYRVLVFVFLHSTSLKRTKVTTEVTNYK